MFILHGWTIIYNICKPIIFICKGILPRFSFVLKIFSKHLFSSPALSVLPGQLKHMGDKDLSVILYTLTYRLKHFFLV